MGYYEAFAYGVGGGAAVELLKWWRLREELMEKGVPDWSRSPLYWVITLVMVLAGGGLVFIHMRSGAVLTALLALQVGASTPLILTGIAREVPILPGKID